MRWSPIVGQVGGDLDIYRSANVLVNQHGEDAPIHAAMNADTILEAGDVEGCAVWKGKIFDSPEVIRCSLTPVARQTRVKHNLQGTNRLRQFGPWIGKNTRREPIRKQIYTPL